MFRNIFAAALMAVSMQAIHLQIDTEAGVDKSKPFSFSMPKGFSSSTSDELFDFQKDTQEALEK